MSAMHAADTPTIDELIHRARAGDQHAFAQAVEPHRDELHRHCYRMTGSLHDADDLVQETLFRAWRGLGTYAGRASFRSWLYRIATNRTLDSLHASSRVAKPHWEGIDEGIEPPWMQPYPGPHDVVTRRETISVAFVVAIQRLPARQRAVLLLRDVLGFSVNEIRALLDATGPSVNSALQRARANLADHTARVAERAPSAEEATLRDQLIIAWERADIDAFAELLTADVRLTMPPIPDNFTGRYDVIETLVSVLAPERRLDHMRLHPTIGNGSAGYGVYGLDPASGRYERRVVMSIAASNGKISGIHAYSGHTAIFDRFNLPLHG